MSGHNKWSKVKNKKAVTDARKSKEFSKLAKLIQNEVKKAGGDTESPGVKTAVAKAQKASMPKENIERALKKGSEPGDSLEDVRFEGYGPVGIGIIVEALTDNNNRTSAEIKHIMTKHGANFGAPGSVSWNFTKNDDTGEWEPINTININEEDQKTLQTIIEALEEQDDVQAVYTNLAT